PGGPGHRAVPGGPRRGTHHRAVRDRAAAAHRRGDRHRRGRGRQAAGRFPRRAQVHLTARPVLLRRRGTTVPDILVYVDHTDGAVRKPTLELLTLARRLGDPVAVHLGPGAEQAAPALAEHGAVRV